MTEIDSQAPNDELNPLTDQHEQTIPMVSANNPVRLSPDNQPHNSPYESDMPRPADFDFQRTMSIVARPWESSSFEILGLLDKYGIRKTDLRLVEFFEYLENHDPNGTTHDVRVASTDIANVTASRLIQKVLDGNVTIPHWKTFCSIIKDTFKSVKADYQNGAIPPGENAQYIPELATVDPDLFAISVCTADGQRFSYGNATTEFCVQSCSKPITYLVACEDRGAQKVHQHVGTEPSGNAFNDLSLKKLADGRSIPHNPMINAGAIMSCSLIKTKEELYKRFKHLNKYWQKACGRERVSFDISVYEAEKGTAHQNWALAHLMANNTAFPEDLHNDQTALKNTMDLYFQTCSIQISCDTMAVLAATLASWGICPTTHEEVFGRHNVRNVLSIMMACGMYDHSGTWIFDVGVPAKSGVSGTLYMVIPGRMGIAIFSPPLDSNGNSVKAQELAKRLNKKVPLHVFMPKVKNVHQSLFNPRSDEEIFSELMESTLHNEVNFAAVATVPAYVPEGTPGPHQSTAPLTMGNPKQSRIVRLRDRDDVKSDREASSPPVPRQGTLTPARMYDVASLSAHEIASLSPKQHPIQPFTGNGSLFHSHESNASTMDNRHYAESNHSSSRGKHAPIAMRVQSFSGQSGHADHYQPPGNNVPHLDTVPSASIVGSRDRGGSRDGNNPGAQLPDPKQPPHIFGYPLSTVLDKDGQVGATLNFVFIVTRVAIPLLIAVVRPNRSSSDIGFSFTTVALLGNLICLAVCLIMVVREEVGKQQSNPNERRSPLTREDIKLGVNLAIPGAMLGVFWFTFVRSAKHLGAGIMGLLLPVDILAESAISWLLQREYRQVDWLALSALIALIASAVWQLWSRDVMLGSLYLLSAVVLQNGFYRRFEAFHKNSIAEGNGRSGHKMSLAKAGAFISLTASIALLPIVSITNQSSVAKGFANWQWSAQLVDWCVCAMNLIFFWTDIRLERSNFRLFGYVCGPILFLCGIWIQEPVALSLAPLALAGSLFAIVMKRSTRKYTAVARDDMGPGAEQELLPDFAQPPQYQTHIQQNQRTQPLSIVAR